MHYSDDCPRLNGKCLLVLLEKSRNPQERQKLAPIRMPCLLSSEHVYFYVRLLVPAK